MQISDIKNPWRERYTEASFRGAVFHVETQTRSGGRRGVLHQFPKRDLPYFEDLGRRARVFAIVGYCIGPNYLDYKEDLIRALELEGPGTLKLPMQADQRVACPRHSVLETKERGGFCIFEMEFVEQGEPGFNVTSTQTGSDVAAKAQSLTQSVIDGLGQALQTDV